MPTWNGLAWIEAKQVIAYTHIEAETAEEAKALVRRWAIEDARPSVSGVHVEVEVVVAPYFPPRDQLGFPGLTPAGYEEGER
jgi:hypothetical protein